MIREGDESVAFEGKHQVRKNVAGQDRRKGARRVPGLSIGDQCSTTRQRHVDKRLTRLRVRQQTSLGHCQNGRVPGLKFASFVE